MSKAKTLFPQSITKVAINSVWFIGTTLTLLQYTLPSLAQSSSPTISPEAMSQIQALEQEKASRNAIERKIDSQILIALRAKRGAYTSKVPNLRSGVTTDEAGRIKVVIHTVSPISNSTGLINTIKAIAGLKL
jgi:hypothetical protein